MRLSILTFLNIAGALLVLLKLTGMPSVADLAWWWVLSPFWVLPAIALNAAISTAIIVLTITRS